jgi:hypothetical protein
MTRNDAAHSPQGPAEAVRSGRAVRPGPGQAFSGDDGDVRVVPSRRARLGAQTPFKPLR